MNYHWDKKGNNITLLIKEIYLLLNNWSKKNLFLFEDINCVKKKATFKNETFNNNNFCLKVTGVDARKLFSDIKIFLYWGVTFIFIIFIEDGGN